MGGAGTAMSPRTEDEKCRLAGGTHPDRPHMASALACQMSMDIHGYQTRRAIDGVEIGGVATCWGRQTSDTNRLSETLL
jgi:hypothetical protein